MWLPSRKPFEDAKKETKTTVIYIKTVPERKMDGYGYAWWDVPIAEVITQNRCRKPEKIMSSKKRTSVIFSNPSFKTST